MSFPGFNAPAVGFDQPIEMLHACHDRVRRSLGLLERLAERVAEGRIDDAVRSAARDVLCYFDLAAPHHHEDEERHVFPLVLARSADAQVHDAVARLKRDHDAMRARWAALRVALSALAEGDDAAFGEPAQQQARDFAALYEGHAELEESSIFRLAAEQASADELRAFGDEMAQRRGARRG